MVFKPKLNEYDINALIVLGNRTENEFLRNKIRMEIVEKILLSNHKILYLIHKFMNAELILKEAYADAILMNMQGNDYYIDNVLVDEILSYASLDVLMYYGADSLSYEFNIKCKDEFYRRGRKIEDKVELQRKRIME